MPTSDIVDYLDKLFSDDGLTIDKYIVKCDNSVQALIEKQKSGIHISFNSDKKPIVSINRKILKKFSLSVLGINFLNEKIVIELDNFPDISLPYKN